MAKVTINTITSGYASVALLNANFDALETAFENTLSRDGTSPNTMTASLDMNSNRILNLPAPANNTDALRLIDLSDSDATGAASATLRVDLAASSGASLVGFIQSGAGAVARTVQDKGRELISRGDFGSSAQFETAIGTAGTTLGYGLLGSLRVNGKHTDDQAWLHVGDADTSYSNNATMLVSRNITGTLSGGSAHGYSDSSTFNAAAASAYNSFDGRISVEGTSNLDHVNMFQAKMAYSNSGTLTQHVGFDFSPSMTAGAITSVYGMSIAKPTLSGGAAINTLYGIAIGDIDNASVNNYGLVIGDVANGSTDNYAIKTGLGNVQFGGGLTLLRLSPEIHLFGTGGAGSAMARHTTNDTLRWLNGVPSGSTDYRFNNGSTDVAILSSVGTFDAVKYKVNGAAGANFAGAVTNITVVDGLVTSIS